MAAFIPREDVIEETNGVASDFLQRRDIHTYILGVSIVDESSQVNTADTTVTIRLKRLFRAWICADHFHSGILVRRRITLNGIPEETTGLGPVSGAQGELVPQFSGLDGSSYFDPVF